MNKILILLVILLFSCNEKKYTYIGQEIIDGRVSAVKSGNKGSYGNFAYLPKIWVQTEKTTKEVEIPFVYENRWKVGDTCLLIIEKYK